MSRRRSGSSGFTRSQGSCGSGSGEASGGERVRWGGKSVSKMEEGIKEGDTVSHSLSLALTVTRGRGADQWLPPFSLFLSQKTGKGWSEGVTGRQIARSKGDRASGGTLAHPSLRQRIPCLSARSVRSLLPFPCLISHRSWDPVIPHQASFPSPLSLRC